METEIATPFHIQALLQLAGLAQIILALSSLAIPKMLNWRVELNKTTTLIRQMFWTYAAYIWVINVCFGLLSVFCYTDLASGSVLAILMNGFIATYWISRVLIQFFYFDRAAFPTGKLYLFGEGLLVLVFIILSIVYAYAFVYNAFLS